MSYMNIINIEMFYKFEKVLLVIQIKYTIHFLIDSDINVSASFYY